MTQTDKNQVMVQYIRQCASMTDNKLFFNYAEESEDANHIVTMADEVALQKPYIDGSVLKRYTFQVICYRPLSANPLLDVTAFADENMDNLAEVQKIIDWIEEQKDERNFPDFGSDTVPDTIYCLTTDPNLYAVDTESDPPLAKYSVVIRYEYIDNSKRIY